MQINRENLDKLLSLNDFQLKMIVNKIAAQGGIDPSQFNIDTNSIESIRRVLGSATDEDIKRIAEQYANGTLNKQNKKR